MRRRVPTLCLVLAAALSGCRGSRGPQQAPPGADEGWAVTAWGDLYEVFAETDGLVAGGKAVSNPHVTVLGDFSPLRSGKVTIVLRGASGQEQAFHADKPKRDGIFPVEIAPSAQGEFELLFRVASAAGQEEIAAGRVRVGAAESPGGASDGGAAAAPDSVSFLKEQQWRTPFSTAWAEEKALSDSVSGPARVRPVAGGEAVVTAPADAAVGSDPWPHVGLEVAKGSLLFRLVPRVGDRSLPEIQGEADALAAEAEAARRRVERLDALLKVEATSPAEAERARAALVALEARLAAARQGLRAAAATGGSARSVEIAAPWPGRVAEVSVSPGQTVSAGTPLARVVRVRPLWLEVSLGPGDAARLRPGRLGLHLRRPGGSDPLAARSASLIARAPEVDPRTGSLAVILEVDAAAGELPIGSSVEAELLLPSQRKGIVVPTSALVQDGGASVVYVQLEGETFSRREVRVEARQGAQAMVEGLRPRERVVTLGGAAVRRSSLLSSGAPEGHVH